MKLRQEISNYGAAPISLSDAKRFLKIDNNADDTVVQMIIDAVLIFAERHTGRELRNNTWFGYADSFGEMIITKDPVESIDSIKYILDGSVVELSSSDYELSQAPLCTEIINSDGKSWPTLIDSITDAVQVTFTTSPHRITPEVIVDMSRHITYLYENRGDDQLFVEFEGIDFYRHSKFPNI